MTVTAINKTITIAFGNVPANTLTGSARAMDKFTKLFENCVLPNGSKQKVNFEIKDVSWEPIKGDFDLFFCWGNLEGGRPEQPNQSESFQNFKAALEKQKGITIDEGIAFYFTDKFKNSSNNIFEELPYWITPCYLHLPDEDDKVDLIQNKKIKDLIQRVVVSKLTALQKKTKCQGPAKSKAVALTTKEHVVDDKVTLESKPKANKKIAAFLQKIEAIEKILSEMKQELPTLAA